MLRRCVASVANQRATAEIIVVVADNDAELREGVAVASELSVASVLVAERGISAVRNAILMFGYKEGADFIAMIDDDETASPMWLAELIAIQRATSADIVAGPVEPKFAVAPSAGLAWSGAFAAAERPDGPTYPVNGTGNFMISTRFLYKADWPRFNAAFGLTGGGDREWFARLSRRGALFAWSSGAVVREYVPQHRMATRWVVRRAYRYGIDDIRIGWAHVGKVRTIRHVASALATLAVSPLDAMFLVSEKTRLLTLRRWARASGRIAGALGFRLYEYAYPTSRP
jgi:glycosyltransferase involved in cell wall biosynthesis